jgi:AcrR family transcriptional regulator
MDALAERARAGKATIYRHWSGKAEVVAAAVRCHQPVDLAAAFDTGSLRGDLVAMVTRMSESMASGDGALIAGVLRAAQGDPALAELLRVQVIEGKQDGFRRLVTRAVRRGELDSAAAADTVFEVARAMVVSHVIVNGEAVTPAFIHHVADAVLLPLLEGGTAPSTDRSEERP